MSLVAMELMNRAATHDNSKLLQPEKAMFDEYTPKLKVLEYGSPKYKAALAEMGDALQAHYRANDHHPEHFANGVTDMHLVQLIEMVCDWAAASQKNKAPVQMQMQRKRFGLEDGLTQIIKKTFAWMDEFKADNMSNLKEGK